MQVPETWGSATSDPLVRDLSLTLGYRHGFGALSPFFAALMRGKALASRCLVCGDVRFPPRRLCLHDRSPTVPLGLDGTGEVVRLTLGVTPVPLSGPAREEAFAEIRMQGADNRVLGRLRGDGIGVGALVRLVTPEAEVPHPIQALVFERVPR